jgi:hypothetical protein
MTIRRDSSFPNDLVDPTSLPSTDVTIQLCAATIFAFATCSSVVASTSMPMSSIKAPTASPYLVTTI